MSAVLLDTRPRRGKHRHRPTVDERLRGCVTAAGGHLRASLRAAFASAVLCSGLLVGLTTVAAGVRL
jgi:hypothetical protein